MAVSPSLVGNVGEAVSSSISNTSLVRTYSACLRSLFSHHGVKLGTERLLQVSSKLGQPHENFDILHVAGTNGKGTTCAKLAACLSMKG
ncbi:bifunctional protein subfamily protein, partial [Cystoisospora suis]